MSLSKLTVPGLKQYILSKGFGKPNLLKADLLEYATVIQNATETQIEEWKNMSTKYPVNYEPVSLRDEYRGDDLPFDDMVDLRLQHLYIYGWTVMPKLPEFEPSSVLTEMLEWFKMGNPDLNVDEYTTWKDAHIATRLHGIIKQRSGHEPWQWDVRKLYKKYFEKIWETDDLLCSFDGWNFSVKSGKKRGIDLDNVSRGWMHIDQARFDREFRCIQGLVCITDVSEKDNSLIVLEGSHEHFDDYLEQRPLEGWEWCFVDGNVTLNGYPAPIKDILHQKISANAGELILWDSRLMHQGGDISNSDVRAAVYVSMMPAVSCSEEDRTRRINTFEANKMTGHWCYDLNFEHKTIKTFKVNTDFMMGIRPKYLPPVRGIYTELLSDPEIRKMVGYRD